MGKIDGSHIARLEKKSLKRVLGVGDLFGVGYGDVGSSIYYALGATALFALGATPLAMALAGFVFICTALSYAELASTFPEPGGSATFTRHAFNDLISFIAGWGLLLDYVVTMAISAFTIPPYLKHVLSISGLPTFESIGAHLIATIVILIILCAINVVGVKYSGKINFIFAALTAIAQLFVVGFGVLFLLNLPHVFGQMKVGLANVDTSPSWGEFLKGMAMAMVAYTGIEAIAQLAGETKKPGSAIPRAIKLTVTVLVVLYFGISLVAMSVISPQELGTTYLEDPIAGIVANFPFGGAYFAPWIGVVAAIVLLVASNAGLIGCSRLTFSMGEFYQVPSACYKTHPKYRTPHISLGIFTVLGCVVVLMSRGKMLFLADLYNIGAQIAFFSAHMALIFLRIKKPTLPRPYRAPLNIPIGQGRSLPLTALIGAVANFGILILVLVTKPEGRYFAMAWMGFGLWMYWYYRRKKRLSIGGQLEVRKIKIPEYVPMHLKNILVAARAKGDTESLQTAAQLARLHNAKLTAVHVIEVPLAMPIDVAMKAREALGEEALRRAQAVAGEYHVTMDLELVRARSIGQAISNLAEAGQFDLVVVGVSAEEFHDRDLFAREAKKVLSETSCRVLFCKH
jgi:APA family basic amino acid/polyamine antiporter